MRIRISTLDRQFSNLMRAMANWRCERCLKQFQEGKARGLHVSHFHGRRKKSVRFDPENIAVLCFGCHQHFGENPLEHTAWFQKRLGEDKFNALLLRANRARTPDYLMVAMWIREMTRSLNLDQKERKIDKTT